LHLRRRRQRGLQLKKHLLLLLLLEKRSQESLNYKLNLIEKLLRLRRLDSLMRRRRQNVKKLRLRS
jgi:hypothetical protein